jgi:RNA-directed DNA polymerase
MGGTQMSRQEVSTKQERIAVNAKRLPGVRFSALAHYIDVKWLYEAYNQTRKDAAPGTDGMTAEEYAENLSSNLQSLLDRAKSGTYRAPSIKRVYIPKGKGKETRPLGIPTFEDKVLQRAVKMVLEPLYEQEFCDCSYGFRPGRSQHMAITKMRNELMKMKGGWIIDIDIKRYFDTIDHQKLREVFSKRVCDGVITRLIGKWLKAGIQEEGKLYYSKEGTPQGGVLSPLLSNVYLHEVLDVWFEDTAKPLLKSSAFMVRFADDVIIGFQDKEDAQRVYKVLPKRFAKYGLTLHPEKTRLICFRKPKDEKDKSDTFDFLGFTHYWGKSRRGYYVIKHKTAKGRVVRTIRNLNIWLKKNRHKDIKEQQAELCRKLQGHYAYYGITFNYNSLYRIWEVVKSLWKKWLSRRSRKSYLSWDKFRYLLVAYPLTKPRIVHSIYTAKP